MPTAEAVVIGGGVHGLSVAYHLAERGLRGVLLAEQGSLGSGASSRNAGLVFNHYTNAISATLALKSYDYLASWPDRIGGSAGFRQTGFLCLVAAEDVAVLEANVAMLQRIGVPTKALTTAEVTELQPFLNLEGVGGAAYEPRSGWLDSPSATTSLARRARDLGVDVREGARATAIRVRGDRVVGVEFAGEGIETPIVVLCAGAWSAALARTANVVLAITPRRLSAGLLQRPPELRAPHMVLLDFAAGFYARPDTDGATLLGIGRAPWSPTSDAIDPDRFDESVADAAREAASQRLTQRLPAMREAKWQQTWSGVDGYTPDRHPIIGRVAELEGLYVDAGHCGTGFNHGPGAGLALAELILEGRTKSFDLHAFRPSRFTENELVEATNEYMVGPRDAEARS